MIMQGVILDLESLDHQDLDLDRLHSVLEQWHSYPSTAPDETVERIKDASIVITNKVVLGKDEIDAAKNLKLICVAATGTNNIDLDAARQNGVLVCNVRAYGTPSVVEHVFTGLLTLVRNMMPIVGMSLMESGLRAPIFACSITLFQNLQANVSALSVMVN